MATVDQLRADVGATIILLLTVQAVDPTDGTTSTWRFSTHQDLPPDTPFKYHPYLKLSAPYVAALASGAALSGPSRLDYGEFRIANPGAGDAEDDYGDRPLDDLATLELSGQPLSVDVVGRTSEGEWVLYADREAWIPAGIVGETPAWDPASGITLPILEPGNKLTRRLYPPYRGLGKALMFNGLDTAATVTGSEWQAPGDFTIQIFALYGELPSTVFRGLFDKGGKILASLAASSPYRDLLVSVQTATDTASVIATPTDSSVRMAWINITYNATSGLLSAWVDEDAATTDTASGGGAADVSTETVHLGGNAASTPGYGPMQFRLWDRVVPRAELIGYQAGPLPPGGGGSLIADWRDYDVGLTTLYDYGPSRDGLTGSSSLDASISNGVAGHTLEGGPELSGTDRPALVGYYENMPAIPIAPEFGLYQTAVHPSHIDSFYDSRSPYAREILIPAQGRTAVASYLFSSIAGLTSGEFIEYWPMSIVRIVNRSEGGQLTADGWGASLWGIGAYLNGTSAYLTLPTAADSVFNSNSWTLEFAFRPHGAETRYEIFARGSYGASVSIEMLPNRDGEELEIVFKPASGLAVLQTVAVPPHDPVFLSISYSYDGSTDSTVKVYVNGREVADFTFSGALASYTGGGEFGRVTTSGTTRYGEITISQIRIWSDVRTADEIATFWTRQPDGESNLDYHYRAPFQFISSVFWNNSGAAGSTSTYRITPTNAVWYSGVPVKGTIDGTRWLLDRVGVLPADTDLESALATVADAAVSAYYGTPPPGDTSPPQTGETRLPGQQLPVVAAPDGEPTAQLMIDRLRIAQHCYLIYDRGTGLYTLVQLVDPSTISPSPTLDADDLLSTPEPVEVLRPSGLYRVGWGPVAIAMTDEQFAASVSDEDRAYYSRTLRYATRAVDASAYPLSPPTYSVNATFRHESEAVAEAVRLAGILGTRRVAYRAPLRYGLLQGAPPGAGRTLSHRRLPADLPAIVLSTEDVATRGSLILLG